MVGVEVAEWVRQVGPVVSAAVGSYGVAVLSRAEDAAADASVGLGQRIVQAVWRRGDAEGRAELERAVGEAAQERDEAFTVAVLGRVLRQALEADAGLREELFALAPVAGSVTVTASGERSIAGQYIGTAITGDGHTLPRS